MEATYRSPPYIHHRLCASCTRELPFPSIMSFTSNRTSNIPRPTVKVRSHEVIVFHSLLTVRYVYLAREPHLARQRDF